MKDFFTEKSIEKIKEASENNKLVVFVGAGVSANSEIPNWEELLKKMAQDLGEFELPLSQESYLKIPQYYYNERGEKEYYEKLNEIFLNKKYKTNPIHGEIFKLKPSHLITTNYDELLEEAAIEEGKFYHTVRQDIDLPYDNLNRTIIKMHGDFKYRNIVLKEDDYLNYSINFKLIESYIKSLIATNTVLFVGYSVNDPNFNLVFQWVKNILNTHFQPAYLIESSKGYSRIEHAYYKNRGINILYYDAEKFKENNRFDISNYRGNNLYDVLNHMNSYKGRQNIGYLEDVYERLSDLEKLNFIMPQQVIKILGPGGVVYGLRGNEVLTLLDTDHPLYQIFKNVEKYKNEPLFNKIVNVLDRANISSISDKQETIYEIAKDNQFIENIFHRIINEDSLLNGNEKDNIGQFLEEENYMSMLKVGYYYYEKNEYRKAYSVYKTISLRAFQDKEYLYYFISEFNRKQTGRLLTGPTSIIECPKEIKEEIDSLDLEEIYLGLPRRERRSLEFLKEIQDFSLIYRTQNDLNKEVRSLIRTKHLIEKGGMSYNNSINNNYQITKNIWLFVKSNYLCIDKYTEFQSLYLNYIEGILASHSIDEEKATTTLPFVKTFSKVEKLDKFDIYVVVTKLTIKELNYLIEDYKLDKIKINEEGEEYINQLLNKYTYNISENIDIRESEAYLDKILVLLSKGNIDSERVEQISEKLLLTFKTKRKFDDFHYINKFIVAMYKKGVLTQNSIYKMIEEYLKLYSKDKESFENSRGAFYNNLANIYQEKINPSNNVFNSILDMASQYYKSYNWSAVEMVFGKIILPLYENLGEKKVFISEVVANYLEEIEKSYESICFSQSEFYYSAIMRKIVAPSKKINKLILEKIEREINEKKDVEVYPDPVETGLFTVVNLYRNGYISQEEINDYIEKLRGNSEYFDLVILKEASNLSDINILQRLNSSELEELLQVREVKEKVYSLVEKVHLSDDMMKKEGIVKKLYERKF